MALISKKKAMSIIQPHANALCAIPIDAWDQYHAELPEHILLSFCSRTRASAVHNLMLTNATKYAVNATGIKPFRRQKMDGIVVVGMLAIRFKKLDDESQSRNQPTAQVDAFRAQQMLDGIDAAHNLELGYVLNEHETAITEVRLVCPSGRNEVAWWTTLGNRGTDSGTVELFPITPDSGPRPPHIAPKETGIVIPIRKKSDED